MSPDLLAELVRFAESTSKLPENHDVWTYTIRGFDGSPYLTRTLLPRVGDLRTILHQIHREDYDSCMHNHPWVTAKFVILSGGYTEERLVGDAVVEKTLRPGDLNELNANTYHRVTSVLPGTVTLGMVGERIQDWGFLVDDVHVPHGEFFARRGHILKSEGKS